jgi:hypothetical protein
LAFEERGTRSTNQPRTFPFPRRFFPCVFERFSAKAKEVQKHHKNISQNIHVRTFLQKIEAEKLPFCCRPPPPPPTFLLSPFCRFSAALHGELKKNRLASKANPNPNPEPKTQAPPYTAPQAGFSKDFLTPSLRKAKNAIKGIGPPPKKTIYT